MQAIIAAGIAIPIVLILAFIAYRRYVRQKQHEVSSENCALMLRADLLVVGQAAILSEFDVLNTANASKRANTKGSSSSTATAGLLEGQPSSSAGSGGKQQMRYGEF